MVLALFFDSRAFICPAISGYCHYDVDANNTVVTEAQRSSSKINQSCLLVASRAC